jgi:hypothetical protein
LVRKVLEEVTAGYRRYQPKTLAETITIYRVVLADLTARRTAIDECIPALQRMIESDESLVPNAASATRRAVMSADAQAS